MEELNCKCWTRPFEPPRGCFDYCMGKILKFAKAEEMIKYLNLPENLANKIFELTADENLIRLSDFKPKLESDNDYDLLESKLKNLDENGWQWIETEMKDRLKSEENVSIQEPA